MYIHICWRSFAIIRYRARSKHIICTNLIHRNYYYYLFHWSCLRSSANSFKINCSGIFVDDISMAGVGLRGISSAKLCILLFCIGGQSSIVTLWCRDIRKFCIFINDLLIICMHPSFPVFGRKMVKGTEVAHNIFDRGRGGGAKDIYKPSPIITYPL